MSTGPMGADPIRPNFAVIGAARSGTTALCSTLAQHPEVFLTRPKEVHFFAHANRPTTYTGPGDDTTVNRNLITDPDRYRSLYTAAAGHRARGEGSVSTLYMADRSIPAIEAFAEPDIKLIAILREPVARAYSSYLYLRGRGFEDRETFIQALALEEDRCEAGYHHMWQFRAMSRYSRQIPAFVDAFGERLKIIVFEEYRRDPMAHLVELCRFIGVAEGHRFLTEIDTNRGGVPRSDLLVKLMSGIRRTTVAQQLVRATTPSALRERVRAVNLRRPVPPAPIMAELGVEFAEDRRCVEAVLGRPIPDWRRP